MKPLLKLTFFLALVGVSPLLGQTNCQIIPPTLTPNLSFNIMANNACNWGTYFNANTTEIDLLLSGHAPVPGINFMPMATPAPPAIGLILYQNTSDLKFHYINPAGTDLVLGNGGSGGSGTVGSGTTGQFAIYPSSGTAVGGHTLVNGDIIPLFGGACSSVTFLRGDGQCATPSGAGNVTAGGVLTNNQLVVGVGSQGVQALGSLGTSIQVLHGNAGGLPIFGPVNLGTDITGSLALSSLATIVNNSVVGNVSGGAAVPSPLTQTQLTGLINTFSSSLSGAVPASGGGSVNFLRADGTWAAPGGGTGGGINQLTGDGTAGPGTGSQVFTLAAFGTGAGSCGDSTHTCQILWDTKGRQQTWTNVAISGGGGGSTATGLQTATFASPPSATGAGGIYFDTSLSQPGIPIFIAGASGTGSWNQILSLVGTGLLWQGNYGLKLDYTVLPCLACSTAFTAVQTAPAWIGPPAGNETVSFVTSPTFSTGFLSSQITLTNSLTTFTLGTGLDGQHKTLTFCQNGTGGFIVTTIPGNVHGFFVGNSGQIGTTASKCNTQEFVYYISQTAWIANSPGVVNQ